MIVIRNDLKLTKGKLIAQACHACYDSATKVNSSIRSRWKKQGQKKIVVEVNNLEEMKKLKQKADKLKVKNSLIKDAGLTEIPPGTVTCLGIGPDQEKKINKITGSLKLLK